MKSYPLSSSSRANSLVPDFVHVLYNGRIVKSGTKELALELEERGYDFIKNEVGQEA